jgi:2-polyprenyl-6-methoxyphenol hydroxylase-like FAD-dependent oxidoreductase
MSDTTTAAIIGGGIGGLTTALALHNVGIDATVYERADVFSEVGAGISLWPNATRILRDLGVLDKLLPNAGRIGALNVKDARGNVLLRSDVSQQEVPSLCVYRPDLIEALRVALPPNTCRTGHTLQTFHDDGNQVQLEFANGTTTTADIVIGADGIRSTVRNFLFANDDTPVYRGYPIWRGIAPLPTSFVAGEISETWGGNQRFGVLDVGEGRAYWYATAPRPEGQQEDPDTRKRELLEAFANWHAPIPEVIATTPVGSLLRSDTYDRLPKQGWFKGRVVLLGDAIHATTPNLGQGGCMSIEDAVVLARYLTAHPYQEAFQRYEDARYKRTTDIITESLWIGRFGLASGALGWLRNTVTKLTPNKLYEQRSERIYSYVT